MQSFVINTFVPAESNIDEKKNVVYIYVCDWIYGMLVLQLKSVKIETRFAVIYFLLTFLMCLVNGLVACGFIDR